VHSRILIDTGPLVAILDAGDGEHDECTERLHKLQTPLLTCWPVVTEAAWLLQDNPSALQELFLTFNTGLLKLLELDDAAMIWIAAFCRKYHKQSPQLADAALVYLAEREGLDTIFTLDRRDFSVYRIAGNRALQIL
jgi:predicted nucleic acid-binding protein